MADQRPYARFEVADLESIFLSRELSVEQLRALADELALRTSTRATLLWKKVRAAIAAGSDPAVALSRSTGRPSARVGGSDPSARVAVSDPAVLDAERRYGPILERVRKRLLDLTANNALLNYRHPKASSLRVVDEVPAQVFDLLLSNASMEIVGLPDPVDLSVKRRVAEDGLEGLPLGALQQESQSDGNGSHDPRAVAREERKAAQARRDQLRARVAEQAGVNANLDLPATHQSSSKRHQDKKLQTLLFPDELEEQLRKLRRTAETIVEETGANRLHLMFGFVEWHESGHSEAERVSRLAPLVLLPVRLTRGNIDKESQTYRYAVERTGEEWSANVSLQEKCRTEFGFILPDVDLGSDESIEHYFSRVEAIMASARPSWKLRRYVTLGVVSFGKVLMWRDLDPKLWPPEHPLFANEALRDLLGAEGVALEEPRNVDALGADYPLDLLADTDPSQVPPTIIEADSSQHSALVDVARGVNLVLQGPPGTGKSQTIANLIASAIGAGKRVLFVAEKKAALEVVFRRLEEAGLGDYCLALHSHTSAKKEFIAGLAERLALRGAVPSPKHVEAHEVRHRDARAVLNEHAARMHEPLETCGLTPFEIFWRAQRLTGRFDSSQVERLRDVRVPKVAHATLADVQRRRDLVSEFAAAYRQVVSEAGLLWRHPWSGVANAQLTFADVNDLLDCAREMQLALVSVQNAVATLGGLVGDLNRISALSTRSLCGMVQHLQPLDDSVAGDLPSRIVTASDVPQVREAVEAVEAARAKWAAIPGPFGEPGTITRGREVELAQVMQDVVAMCGAESSIERVREIRLLAQAAYSNLNDASRVIRQIAETSDGVQVESPARLAIAACQIACDAVALFARAPDAMKLRVSQVADAAMVERLRSLSGVAAPIRERRIALALEYPPSLRPDHGQLHQMVRALSTAPRFLPGLLSGAYRQAVRDFRAMSGGRRSNRQAMTSAVLSLIALNDDVASFETNEAICESFGPLAAGVDSPFAALLDLADWRGSALEHSRELEQDGRELVRRLWQLPEGGWAELVGHSRINSEIWGAANNLSQTLRGIADVAELRPYVDTARPLSEIAAALATAVATCERAVALAAEAGVEAQQTLGEVNARVEALRAAWSADDALTQRAEVLIALGIPFAGPATEVSPIKLALAYIADVRATRVPAAVSEWLLHDDTRRRLQECQRVCANIEMELTLYERAASAFCDAGMLDQATWLAADDGEDAPVAGRADALFSAEFDALHERVNYALSRAKALHPWAVYRHSRAEAITDGLLVIVELVEQGHVDSEGAADAYEAAFFRSLAELVLGASSALDHFDSGKHGEVQHRFAKLDAELQVLTRQRIAHELSVAPAIPGNPGPRVSDLTDEALLRHNIGKQRQHSAIRELFRRAGRSILTLKPCFMMGPQAVAQYLQPGSFEFDLVVMDEASQMRPEDALGAIARARQVVVVGDPMQLGPTRFFDKADSDDDEAVEEELQSIDGDGVESSPINGATVLERSESILLAAAARFGTRMLRWHYRSRHPKLIAYSNREFYHERLIVFPASGANDAHDGVFLQRVPGLYSGRRNVPEAQAIVQAIREHAAKFPDRSLLVATMNAEQADLVDQLMGQAEKEDQVLADYLLRHENGLEPFAIKNLENVQGDQRDVIFVSVTFGPDGDGRLMQRFGPILQSGGERRLNVLFTRAKHRLDVFCSFDPNELRVAPTSPRGLRVLRDYLKFASGEVWWASGTETGRAPDSDFEIAIADGLRARGYETRPQIGVAGYFIDMAVVHPDLPGRFILGIEADGATYHSAKTARDRDRLRQSQLEALGWNIHRVWSTDYFRDPDGQVSRIVARIESLRSEGRDLS